MKMAEYSKAIASAVGIGYALYQTATSITSPGGVGVTSDEWQGIAVTTLVTALIVWLVPNAKPESVSEKTLTIEQTSTQPLDGKQLL